MALVGHPQTIDSGTVSLWTALTQGHTAVQMFLHLVLRPHHRLLVPLLHLLTQLSLCRMGRMRRHTLVRVISLQNSMGYTMTT